MRKEPSTIFWMIMIIVAIVFLLVGIITLNKINNMNLNKGSALCKDYSQLKQWCSDSCVANNQTNNPYIYTNEKDIYICSCINSVINGTQNYVPLNHIIC